MFEVPYELPFIALTEKAFTRLVNEQYEVLQRGIAIHKRLERLVLEESGLDEVVRALAAAIGGAVCVLSARGETIASRTFRRQVPAAAMDGDREEVRRSARRSSRPTIRRWPAARSCCRSRSAARARPQAWLVAARDAGGLGDFERLILQQAVTVVALELMRQRAMRDTERRLAGDVLAEALTGRPSANELAVRLRPFGVGAEAAVIVFAGPRRRAAGAGRGRPRPLPRRRGRRARSWPRASGSCARWSTRREDIDAVALAARAREALAAEHGELRAAASRPAPVGSLRRTFHEARCALEAAALANGAAPPVASYRDLGAFQLLLSLQDDDALRLYCDSVLGPLEDGSGEYGDELLRSLEAFIEQNGQWEKAARELYCHRHTLRYRIRRVEELTGRDLSSARDRIEFWLALRARELVQT